MTQRQRRHIWEMLPIFLIALALLYYCCTAALCYGQLDAKLGTLSQGWTLNGEAVEALPARDMRAPGEKTVMRAALPDILCAEPVECRSPSFGQFGRAASD